MTSLVVGAGRSGVALARHLTGAGERVRVIDSKPAPELEHTLAQLVPGVEVSVGGYDERVLEGIDAVYASPGVPWDSELLNIARAAGIPVSSEIALFLRLCPGTVVGITGTNGKTTTSLLVEALLGAGGRPTGVIGTIQYRVGAQAEAASQTTPEALELQALLARMVQAGVGGAAMEVSSHALALHRVDGIA